MHDSVQAWINDLEATGSNSPDADKEGEMTEANMTSPQPQNGQRRDTQDDAISINSTSQSSMSEDLDFELSSTDSGPDSLAKQMSMLEDSDRPIKFLDLNNRSATIQADVECFISVFQPLIDGIGILGYTDDEFHNDIRSLKHPLTPAESRRFRYPWVNNKPSRSQIGTTPPLAMVQEIVNTAIECEEDFSREDTWNGEVHRIVLKLALSTSRYSASLDFQNVKHANIDPCTLATNFAHFPCRPVDYGIMLNPDALLQDIWKVLPTAPGTFIKSWNHTTTDGMCETPLAISIEAKSAQQPWTFARPQVAVWIDAQYKRLEQLDIVNARISSRSVLRPAMPFIIVQGHEWYLFVLSGSYDPEMLTIWQKLDMGNTRSVFETCKLIAVLHGLMYWAENMWRPYLHALVSAIFER